MVGCLVRPIADGDRSYGKAVGNGRRNSPVQAERQVGLRQGSLPRTLDVPSRASVDSRPVMAASYHVWRDARQIYRPPRVQRVLLSELVPPQDQSA